MKKTAIITGASSGIGKAIAFELASEGISLIINSRSNFTALKAVEAEVRSFGVDCISVLGDVSNYPTCKNICSMAASRFSSIDYLINNAGISYVGLFQDMKYDEWDRILKVNLYSVIQMCHAVVPYMLHAHSGKIINISSVWGNVGASCEAVYSASKGGVNSFTKALAKELAPSGICVNAIACGAIDTPMNAWMKKEEQELLMEEIPAGRMGKTKEAAVFTKQLLSSPDYLTGQIIALDGGWQ